MTPEDIDLITRARTARSQNVAFSGAAVRDIDDQVHVGTNVGLPSLDVSALQMALAIAVSAGAGQLNAAAVVSDAQVSDDQRPELSSAESRYDGMQYEGTMSQVELDINALRDIAGHDVPVHFADIAGRLVSVMYT